MNLIVYIATRFTILGGFLLRAAGLRRDPFDYLRFSKGVIHIGAHTGQEAKLYAQYNLPVLWIEAVEEYYNRLVENIKSYPEQTAVNALLGSKNNQEVNFFVGDTLSSMYEIKDLQKIINATGEFKKIIMLTKTLDCILGSSKK
ncbi:MAG: hypothetical protein N3J91_03510, partial [Verrucomicrobiae bacterium]|nr:hypothetical protein [Verrucomicrobiae bacterium]